MKEDVFLLRFFSDSFFGALSGRLFLVVKKMNDRYWMRHALALAERGRGRVAPNPLVGAVLVKDGKLIAEGWHAAYGEAHAEQMALQKAGDAAAGATAYVTLEPCNHVGKTPACSELLIAHGVRRVVVAARDPNPIAAGGIERLQAAGVAVSWGLFAKEAEAQNAAFFYNQRQGLPFVRWKVAATLDGAVAPAPPTRGKSRQISGPPSSDQVQRWRHEQAAIMIGAATLREDDPLLSDRSGLLPTAHPTRVIVGRHPEDFQGTQLLATAADIPTVFATTAPEKDCRLLREAGIEVLAFKGEAVPLRFLMKRLYQQGISEILLEGGASLAQGMLQAGLVNEIAICFAPRLLGLSALSQRLLAPLGETLSEAIEIEDMQSEIIGDDLWIYGRVVPCSPD